MSQDSILRELKRGPDANYLGRITVLEDGTFLPGQEVCWKNGLSEEHLPLQSVGEGPFKVLLVVRSANWGEQIIVRGANEYPVPVHPSFLQVKV